MEIPAKLVMELRNRTGAGMMDCKSSLKEAEGDLDEAEKLLRKRDKVKASKKAGRSANQGLVQSYIHAGARLGVLLEINCETDFASASAEFAELAKDIAMHVAASEPRFINREAVPESVIDGEREIYRAQVEAMGKPANVIDKIVDGKLEAFYGETCLYEQAYVKEPSITVRERIEQTVGKIGENIKVRRFVRFKLGESDANLAIAAEEEGS